MIMVTWWLRWSKGLHVECLRKKHVCRWHPLIIVDDYMIHIMFLYAYVCIDRHIYIIYIFNVYIVFKISTTTIQGIWSGLLKGDGEQSRGVAHNRNSISFCWNKGWAALIAPPFAWRARINQEGVQGIQGIQIWKQFETLRVKTKRKSMGSFFVDSLHDWEHMKVMPLWFHTE